jgi:hypothetical protein
MERGTMTAMGPMLVRTISRESGISRIISIIKGKDRKRFTTLERALYMIRRGASPAGDAA